MLVLEKGEISRLKYLVKGVLFAELLWFVFKYLEITTKNAVSSVFQFKKK